MIDDSMQEIVNDFIQEALELLESLNENFIELEKQPDNKEILNTIFRAAHTVKGSAGFLGFQNIVELAHSAENILNKLRQGEIILTSEMTDYLLKAMDVLKTMIITVSETRSEGEPPEGNAELIRKLNELSEGTAAPQALASSSSEPPSSASAPSVAEEKQSSSPVTDKSASVNAQASGASGKKKARSLGDILLEDNLISKEELEEIYKEKEEEEQKEHKANEPDGDKEVYEAAAEEIVHPSVLEETSQPAAVHNENPAAQTSQDKTVLPSSSPEPKTILQKPAATPPPDIKETTIRVDIERLDNVMNLVGELVLARNRLFNISSKLEIKYADDDLSSALAQVVAGLNLVTTDLQLAVMKTRMQPVKKVFSKFPRMVRDLSRELGKDMELLISGEETELDKSVIEEIGDPLVHLIRNSVDHGIEDISITGIFLVSSFSFKFFKRVIPSI